MQEIESDNRGDTGKKDSRIAEKKGRCCNVGKRLDEQDGHHCE